MQGLVFAKYEGLGNDFIVLDVARSEAFDARFVPRLCDRHFGIGADGVLLVLPPSGGGAVARMMVINADGSVPEMCGNGLRCVALHLASARGSRDVKLTVETDSGPRSCAVSFRNRGEASVHVEMGAVRLLEKRQLVLDRETVDLAIVDAGNPHAVVFRDDPRRDIDRLGPQIAQHPSFPNGTNVELVARHDHELEVLVWERGVGRTLACGTGACAVVAVACARGFVPAKVPVSVRLPGGLLAVTHDPGQSQDQGAGRSEIEGPARLVFRGETATVATSP
jgi:diaminopimelate epimerase